jgi:hypothetical protein
MAGFDPAIYCGTDGKAIPARSKISRGPLPPGFVVDGFDALANRAMVGTGQILRAGRDTFR